MTTARVPLGHTDLTVRPIGLGCMDSTFAGEDFRATLPKFEAENFAHNLRLVEGLKAFADERGHTAGQVALAWLLAQPYDVAPIPGTKQAKYAVENAAATAVALSADDLAYLGNLFDPAQVRGGQYGQMHVRAR